MKNRTHFHAYLFTLVSLSAFSLQANGASKTDPSRWRRAKAPVKASMLMGLPGALSVADAFAEGHEHERAIDYLDGSGFVPRARWKDAGKQGVRAALKYAWPVLGAITPLNARHYGRPVSYLSRFVGVAAALAGIAQLYNQWRTRKVFNLTEQERAAFAQYAQHMTLQEKRELHRLQMKLRQLNQVAQATRVAQGTLLGVGGPIAAYGAVQVGGKGQSNKPGTQRMGGAVASMIASPLAGLASSIMQIKLRNEMATYIRKILKKAQAYQSDLNRL